MIVNTLVQPMVPVMFDADTHSSVLRVTDHMYSWNCGNVATMWITDRSLERRPFDCSGTCL